MYFFDNWNVLFIEFAIYFKRVKYFYMWSLDAIWFENRGIWVPRVSNKFQIFFVQGLQGSKGAEGEPGKNGDPVSLIYIIVKGFFE